VSGAELAAIRVPVLVIPGNDNTHSSAAGLAVHRLIPGAQLLRLPVEDQDVTVITYAEWKQHEPAIAAAIVRFMQEAGATAPA
jgi:hypothetical protein